MRELHLAHNHIIAVSPALFSLAALQVLTYATSYDTSATSYATYATVA
jgi:hypothetical protein